MKYSGKAYNRVASELRERILSRLIQPQEQLPTEHELSREFEVSRITVRRALDILAEEHLIHRRQGKGSFVSPNPVRRIPLLIDYARSVRAHAPQLRRELYAWRWTTPPEEAAEELRISSTSTVLFCQRVDVLDGTPVAFDRAYIPRSFAEGLSQEDLAAVEFNEVWPERSGFQIISCKQVVDAVPADEETVEILRIRNSSPVLKGTEIYYTLHNRPTGIFVNYYHPEYISLVSHFSWSSLASSDEGEPAPPAEGEPPSSAGSN